MQLPGAIALLSLPGATPLRALPVVLILQDALGADGRAAPYVETLLGAGIAVLELREASAEAARNAVAALSSDPRLQPSRLGVLGFGEGARIAIDQPGPSVRALLYPGCVSFPHPRKSAAPGSATWRAEKIDWNLDPEIRAFIGPAEYAWDFNNPSPARLLPAAKQGEAVLLLKPARRWRQACANRAPISITAKSPPLAMPGITPLLAPALRHCCPPPG
jgi:hypothetical protein